MTRPRSDSQAGRILKLLEDAKGAKVSLPAILNLRISQYSARIHDLRHKYGFRIENGNEEGRPDHTWFRLIGSSHYVMPLDSPDRQTIREMNQAIDCDDTLEVRIAARGTVSAPKMVPVGENPMLFSENELQHTARWEDVG